jgi:hypothetical protein
MAGAAGRSGGAQRTLESKAPGAGLPPLLLTPP